MKRSAVWLQYVLAMLLVAALVAPVSPAAAKGVSPGYQTGFQLWRGASGGFAEWTLSGVSLAQTGGQLLLDDVTATSETDPYPAGGYYSGNFYTGGSYRVGEATSPVLPTSFAFQEAIASWNAQTPDGSWVETLLRARKSDGAWTKWYNMGIWASGTGTIQRHSVRLQGDSDGYVAVDTLVLGKSKLTVDALQVKVRLFRADGSTGPGPAIEAISLAYSTAAAKKVSAPSTGDPDNWNTLLAVPECSQMVYPNGGNVWCSPTSTSMVLGYYDWLQGLPVQPCAERVQAAVDGVYDWIYDGHGNWPFNTAYAASHDPSTPMEGYVARFTSLDALEPWVKAGVPVVMSIAWNKNELTGAPVSSSSGHLVVLVGFDGQGNPIVNDPAASDDASVQRTYLRGELESVWQVNSGGTVYLIYQPGMSVPGF